MNKINWIPGKDYLCRDGSKFHCYAFNPDWGAYCVHGRVRNGELSALTEFGLWNPHLCNHPLDIISEWIERPVVKWEMLGPAFDDYKWAAMDYAGEVYIYQSKPTAGDGLWYIKNNATNCPVVAPSFFTFSGDWKDSLVERK